LSAATLEPVFRRARRAAPPLVARGLSNVLGTRRSGSPGSTCGRSGDSTTTA